MKLAWERVDSDRWRSGHYSIWVQARVREGGSVRAIKEYSAQYKDQRPWLCDRGSFADAKAACQAHADGR